MVLDLCVIPPRGGNHVIPAAPVSVSRRKSADVQFDIVGHKFAESVEVAPDNGGVGGVKNGLRIVRRRVGRKSARSREKCVCVFTVHGDRVLQQHRQAGRSMAAGSGEQSNDRARSQEYDSSEP
jgi:hypothetical protein